MEDNLNHLDCFLKVDSRWEVGADGLLQLLARLEDVVGGGGGYSNEV